MQIILLERIAKLGQMGDVVSVKDGYARNFLLPSGKALRANKENLAHFEKERAQLEARNLEQKTEAEAVKAKLDGENVVIIRQSSETGRLYGSVNTRDIATALTEKGFSINRQQVTLDMPIKTLGLFTTAIVLHPEVLANVTINVARTEDEAVRQARGENVIDEKADAGAKTDADAKTKEEEIAQIENIFDEDAQAKQLENIEADESETDEATKEKSEAKKAKPKKDKKDESETDSSATDSSATDKAETDSSEPESSETESSEKSS